MTKTDLTEPVEETDNTAHDIMQNNYTRQRREHNIIYIVYKWDWSDIFFFLSNPVKTCAQTAFTAISTAFIS